MDNGKECPFETGKEMIKLIIVAMAVKLIADYFGIIDIPSQEGNQKFLKLKVTSQINHRRK